MDGRGMGLAAAVGVRLLSLPPHPQMDEGEALRTIEGTAADDRLRHALGEEVRCGYQKDQNGTSMTSTA